MFFCSMEAKGYRFETFKGHSRFNQISFKQENNLMTVKLHKKYVT